MSDRDNIEVLLRRVRRRRCVWNVWIGLWRGSLVGSTVVLAVLGAYKLFPIPEASIAAAFYAGAAALLAGAAHGFFRNISMLDTARWIDQRRHLKERISTAWEISKSNGAGSWQELVLADAARHAKDVQPSHLLPWQIPVVARWVLLLVALTVGVGFMPEYRTKAFKKREADSVQIREVGRRLAEVPRKHLEERNPLQPPTQHSLEEIKELGDLLGKAKLTRAEALQHLSSVREKLDQQTKELGEQPAFKPLSRAATPSGQGSPSQREMQDQMEAMQKALGTAPSDPAKLDALQQKLQEMKQAASKMPDPNSAAGQAERQQLAQAMSELAQQARDQGISLPSLEEAIEALKNGQFEFMVRDLDMAMHDLEKLKGLAQAMQQLEQQLARLGKDLAEQLEHGQVEAAQRTLEKMIETLKSPALSAEQRQKIGEDVAKAIDPAGEYGDVAKHLKNAIDQLNRNQDNQAAQSLADAAKELEKLRQQMGDAQALMAAMAAMDQAQRAIVTGKSWEQCEGGMCKQCHGEGCRLCKGKRWGHGGGAGAGVGTWADEDWAYAPEEQVPVDNSGVQRPDLDSRGHTDRPEDRNPNLNPTKVKGQMAPGQSMPSITLKGVHLKGQSSVKFEEAAAAAQADAQSALNQDQVPRPYINVVRDYFDDLKK